MASQENNPSDTRIEGNGGESSSPMIPYSPSYQPQNRFPGYNTQYAQGMAVPPSPGLGQMFNPIRPQYRNGHHFGNNLYNQDVSNRPHHEYDQPSIPPRIQQYNGSFANPLQHYQCTNTPRRNPFVGVSSPLNPFAPIPQMSSNNPGRVLNPAAQGYINCSNPVPQVNNAPQRYPPFDNGFRSPVAGTARQQVVPQYNSPSHATTPVTSNSTGGNYMPTSSQYPTTPPIGNRSNQNLTLSQVPEKPQWRAKGYSLPRSTPASKSSGSSSGSATPEADDIAIQRKPAMSPKKYHLRAEHLMPGCIVWLSNYEEGHEPILCVQNHECNDKVKDKDGRNHPVMILRINQRRGSNIVGNVMLDVALMTTLSGMPLDKYVNKLRTLGPDPSTQWYLKETMPLSWVPQQTPQLKGNKLDAMRKHEQNRESQHHAELNQRGNTLLFLSRGSMQRRSYVRVHHIYAVPIKQLQACSRYAKLAHMVRLDEYGYRRVMEVLSLVPEPWESSIERSVAAAPQRLTSLRDEEMVQFNAIQLAESQPRRDEAVMQQGYNVVQQSPLGNASDVEAEGRESC
ncbi:uncharacterized protein EAF01_003842 [Botrytis porri]|uniref:Uncharacterized protein n=1 Tax=Botrytis porri TaxID=87229 RepID=A0A4Z1KH06_9HELO|nr:uncharacterized protein EAF01_003842 [Botrytis porri]KAF7908087.1 hypothetical protein EAF01_003842 [Botrytis porri]TGO84818.1 hypothetical protein BPOR_0462g00080 [Botrytis porri]